MIKKIYFSKTKHTIIDANISCIGNFDAVHKGHQALIKKTISLAKEKGLKAYIIVFSKDPNFVLFKEKPINSLSERIKLFDKFGLDGVIIIDCDINFLNTSYKDFINNYLKKMNINGLVVGKDYTFGKNRCGNVKELKKSFKNVYVCDSVNYYGKKISTTRIKNDLKHNKINSAKRMLGYENR